MLLIVLCTETQKIKWSLKNEFKIRNDDRRKKTFPRIYFGCFSKSSYSSTYCRERMIYVNIINCIMYRRNSWKHGRKWFRSHDNFFLLHVVMIRRGRKSGQNFPTKFSYPTFPKPLWGLISGRKYNFIRHFEGSFNVLEKVVDRSCWGKFFKHSKVSLKKKFTRCCKYFFAWSCLFVSCSAIFEENFHIERAFLLQAIDLLARQKIRFRVKLVKVLLLSFQVS